MKSNSNDRIRIGIAEDHELVREGFKALFKSDPRLEVVGEAADGLQAVELVEKLKPAVLLLDLKIPRLHGLEVLRRFRGQETTRFLIVTMHSDEPYLMEALKNGASGYIVKDSPATALLEAIRIVAAGGEYVCEPLRRKTLAATLKQMLPGTATHRPLTKRELIVLEHAASGKTSMEIAKELFISHRTVEAHRSNLMKKLGLQSQTDLVLYAIRNGIMAP